MVKKLLEVFTPPKKKKKLQKTNQEKFRIENLLKRKGDNLYVKWKGCDNSFDIWIDKKDHV